MRRKVIHSPDSNLRTLQWISTKGTSRAYELRSGADVLGRLRWPKMFGSLAEAEFGENRWTIKRGGFLRPRVTIRPQGAADDSGILELSSGGSGILRTNGGCSFPLNRQGFWSQRFVFTDVKGSELVVIEPKIGLLRRTGVVHVHEKASKLRELPLLVLLGWYVTMLISDDDAAVVAVCCS